jgi:hypothetical protein
MPIAGNPGFGPWQAGMDIFDGADYRNFPFRAPIRRFALLNARGTPVVVR